MLDLVRPLLDVTPTVSSVCPATLFCFKRRFFSSTTTAATYLSAGTFLLLEYRSHFRVCFYEWHIRLQISDNGRSDMQQ